MLIRVMSESLTRTGGVKFGDYMGKYVSKGRDLNYLGLLLSSKAPMEEPANCLATPNGKQVHVFVDGEEGYRMGHGPPSFSRIAQSSCVQG
jgi:hypothetical protein